MTGSRWLTTPLVAQADTARLAARMAARARLAAMDIVALLGCGKPAASARRRRRGDGQASGRLRLEHRQPERRSAANAEALWIAWPDITRPLKTCGHGSASRRPAASAMRLGRTLPSTGSQARSGHASWVRAHAVVHLDGGERDPPIRTDHERSGHGQLPTVVAVDVRQRPAGGPERVSQLPAAGLNTSPKDRATAFP